MLAVLLLFLVDGGFVDWDFENYAAWYRETEQRMARSGGLNEIPLPGPDELTQAQALRFQRYTGNFWGEAAYTIVARYGDAAYARQKAEIDARIEFETEPILQRGERLEIVPAFRLDRFEVRMVRCCDRYWTEFPKDMCWIGTADATGEILYIVYDDVNLDALSEPIGSLLPKLIHWNSFGWPECLPLLRGLRCPVFSRH